MASEDKDSDLNEYLQAGQCQLEGLLMKLSSKNVWQKRFYQLRGPFLMYWANPAAAKKSILAGCEVGTPNVSIDLRLIRDADVLTGQVLILTSKSNQMFSLKPAGKGNITEWVEKINFQIKQESENTVPISQRKHSRQTVMVLQESMREADDAEDEPNTDETLTVPEAPSSTLETVSETEADSATAPTAVTTDVDTDKQTSKFNEDEAATKVQAITRSKLSKKRVENIKEVKKQEKATVKIQNLQRKKTALKEVETKRAAKKEREEDEKKIVKLQGLIRQKDAKRKVELKREEKKAESVATPEATSPTVDSTSQAVTEDGITNGDDSSFRGVLEKQGHFVNTGYKKRMFVLTKDKNQYWSLNYYEHEGQGRLGEKKGEIELKNATITTSEEDETEFTVSCPDKTFPLRALSLEEAADWKKRLENAISDNNNNVKGSAIITESFIKEADNGEAVATANGGNNGGPSFRGVLEKAGHFLNTSYKKRLFVLASTPPSENWVMFYYVEAGAGRLGELKGEINLSGAEVVDGVALNEFSVNTKDKNFPLRAADDETANKWKDKIKQAIQLSS